MSGTLQDSKRIYELIYDWETLKYLCYLWPLVSWWLHYRVFVLLKHNCFPLEKLL